MHLKPVALLGLMIVPLAGLGLSAPAQAETVNVAVAANFTDAAKLLGAVFKTKTGDDVAFSFGATGGLYTQISQGAPFEAFLSADSKTAKKAVDNGFAVKGSDFTYAVGQIVLFSTDAKLVDGAATLKSGSFDKLAIADPKTAPYGAAAIAAMKKLGVYDAMAPKLVVGANISQTYQFVDTGNVQLGFVALSQVVKRKDGSRWVVPQADYAPITQDAVLLAPGKDSAVAKAFLDFLKSPDAVKLIEGFGYGVPGR